MPLMGIVVSGPGADSKSGKGSTYMMVYSEIQGEQTCT